MNISNNVQQLISNIKQSKLRRKNIGSNCGKMVKQEEPVVLFSKYGTSEEQFNFIITQIKRNEYPTIDSIRETLLNGVRRIYNDHVYTHGQLTHDCCFSEYQLQILKLIQVILNK